VIHANAVLDVEIDLAMLTKFHVLEFKGSPRTSVLKRDISLYRKLLFCDTTQNVSHLKANYAKLVAARVHKLSATKMYSKESGNILVSAIYDL